MIMETQEAVMESSRRGDDMRRLKRAMKHQVCTHRVEEAVMGIKSIMKNKGKKGGGVLEK